MAAGLTEKRNPPDRNRPRHQRIQRSEKPSPSLATPYPSSSQRASAMAQGSRRMQWYPNIAIQWTVRPSAEFRIIISLAEDPAPRGDYRPGAQDPGRRSPAAGA